MGFKHTSPLLIHARFFSSIARWHTPRPRRTAGRPWAQAWRNECRVGQCENARVEDGCEARELSRDEQAPNWAVQVPDEGFEQATSTEQCKSTTPPPQIGVLKCRQRLGSGPGLLPPPARARLCWR
jgi:hypothetical protein